MVRRAGVNLLCPERRAGQRIDAEVEAYLDELQVVQRGPLRDGADPPTRSSFLRQRACDNACVFLLPQAGASFRAGTLQRLLPLVRRCSRTARDLVLEVTRGLPHNVTTEMDLALWHTAQAIRATPVAGGSFKPNSRRRWPRCICREACPPAARPLWPQFMRRYGMRGVGEIDLGRARWREDPTPVMQALQKLPADRPGRFRAGCGLCARGRQRLQAAVETLAAQARQMRGGWLKTQHGAGWRRGASASWWALRESPKFFAIRMMGKCARWRCWKLRRGMLAQAGQLERADDLIYLQIGRAEKRWQPAEPRDWKALVAERRAVYAREQRRRQAPRMLLSDGHAILRGAGGRRPTPASGITGSPVSPGMVEGIVHVVLDPRGAQLAPGEILVCPGTDPAWTPLFLAAGGLVMEVGGMMTHGSVVAREYGIPAVVGVHQATPRLKTGQRIRMDGSSGQITILEQESPLPPSW